MDAALFLRGMLARLPDPFTGESLFDRLPDIVYFIKDARCRYVVVNQTLVERCGLRDKSQVIGRTAGEVLRPPLGTRFEAQDRSVLKTGRPLIAQLGLHLYTSRDVGWCLTSKLPLVAVGVVGVSQDLRLPSSSTQKFRHLLAAVSYALEHIATPPTVQRLAVVAGISRFQLGRRMRGVFGLTTGHWLLELRLDRAQRMLCETTDSVADIAMSAGYSDQSAFTRQFRRATGLSPRAYRTARGAGPLGGR